VGELTLVCFTILTFQNIEDGQVYNVVLHIMSADSVDLSVSLTSSDGSQNLAQHTIQ
jgi:alpha-L-arabinofuranosidase